MSRPFDPKVLARAREIALTYQLVLTPEESLGYLGRTLEMPMVMSDGPDVASCADNVIEATIASIATMLERGETPPAPAREGRRDQQVNIRVSAEERARLAANAAAAGFRSISDFVRSAALGSR